MCLDDGWPVVLLWDVAVGRRKDAQGVAGAVGENGQSGGGPSALAVDGGHRQLMSGGNLPSMSDNPPIALMLLPLPLVVGSIIGAVVGFVTGSWLWAVVALVLVALAVGAAAFLVAESMALRLLKARPLADGGSHELRNQLEELCARTGLSEPDLYTVGPGAPAIASVGRVGSALIVTDGLTDDLTIVELEAAVARELARIQSGFTTVDTLAVPFITVPFGFVSGFADKVLRFFRGGDHDARIDLEGIAITRYPPGMSAALSKMTAVPSVAAKAAAHLWAVGSLGPGKGPGSYGIDERIELLQEL